MKVGVPFVGGPVAGRIADVELDDDLLPPPELPESWLWTTFGSELLNADLVGAYHLEPVAQTGPPWLYVWISG